MAVTATWDIRLDVNQTGGNDFAGDRFKTTIRKLQTLTDGTSANQADIFWADERTVNASTNDDIDLAGALSDTFGTTVAAAEIVALLIIHEAIDGTANTSDLTIGNAGSNPWEGVLDGTSPTIGPIKPGGVVFIGSPNAAGIGAVTGGSADVLRVANGSGASATYQIAVLARTA